MNTASFSPDKIEILEFKIIKGEINSPFEFNQDKLKGHHFELGYEVGFNLDEKLAKVDFHVQVNTQSEGNKEEGHGAFSVTFIYGIGNLAELAIPMKKTDELEVDGRLANALASITYSTTRGILMTRFQGTVLASFILPVIDPNELMKSEKNNNKKTKGKNSKQQ